MDMYENTNQFRLFPHSRDSGKVKLTLEINTAETAEEAFRMARHLLKEKYEQWKNSQKPIGTG